MKYVGQNHHELCVNTEEAPEPGEVCVNGDFQGVKPAGNLSCAGQGGITQAGSKLTAFPTTVALFFFLSSFFFPPPEAIFLPCCPKPINITAPGSLSVADTARSRLCSRPSQRGLCLRESWDCAGASALPHCAALFSGTLQHLGWLCFIASCVSRSACPTMGDKRKIVSR